MPDESLPKSLIIRRKDEMELMFSKGRRRYGKLVTLIVLPMDAKSPEPCKVAFLCGKRVGNAAMRNLCKRRLREIFRRNKPLFAGLRVLLMAQPPAVKADLTSLRDDVLGVMKELRS